MEPADDPDGPAGVPRRGPGGRALALGFGLAALVAGFTYFNDAVVRQTPFIGNFLPVSVFGLVLVAALGLNPLLGRLARRRGAPRWLRPLRPVELGLAAALGLGACGWAGSGYFRTFLTVLVVPGDQIRANPAWSAAGVMSYVPGGDPALAPGQLRGLAGRVDGGEVDPSGSLAAALGLFEAAGGPASPLAMEVAARLPEGDRALLRRLGRRASASSTDADRALRALNALVQAPAWVEASRPDGSRPPPRRRWPRPTRSSPSARVS